MKTDVPATEQVRGRRRVENRLILRSDQKVAIILASMRVHLASLKEWTMSEVKKSPTTSVAATPVPAWLGAGLIGLVLGVGGTLIVMRAYTLNLEDSEAASVSPPPGGPPPMMGGPMPGPTAGGMGGGGFGGGGFGGGGRGGNQRLTALVGKLELLTRENLHVELTPDQSKQVAEQLAKLDQAEKLTSEEAQSSLESLEGILTAEQKTTLESINLPFARRGNAGGPGGGGPGGAGPAGGGPGGPPPMGGGPPMGMMMSGGGGGASDENPFRQEANQKRLRDLLARLPAPEGKTDSKAEPASTEPATSEPKAEETKAAEAKAEEAKAAEAKEEAKADETKADETKSEETKP